MTSATTYATCVLCRLFLTGHEPDEQVGLIALARFLDDRQRVAGHPHRHVSKARRRDLDACDAVIQTEIAQRQRITALLGSARALADSYRDDDESPDDWVERVQLLREDATTVVTALRLLRAAQELEDARTTYLPPAGKRVFFRRKEQPQ